MGDFHADRRLGVGGSDARDILEGRWHQLWLEKTGRAKKTFTAAEQFRMALGTACEPVILDEFRRRHADLWANKPAEQLVHPVHTFARCHLDFLGGFGALQPEPEFIGEIKMHFGEDGIEDLALDYGAQVQHNMMVAGLQRCWFVAAFGRYAKYAELEIEADEAFQKVLLEREEEFWSYVTADIEPPDAKPAKVKMAVDKMRVVCMDKSNTWTVAAMSFVETQEAAGVFELSKTQLKNMVDPDVRLAFGRGVVAKRDGRGVTVKVMTEEDRIRLYPEEVA